MNKVILIFALLAVAQAQQTFRTVTTRTQEQPLSVQVLPQTQTIRTINTVGGTGGAQAITLQGLQGLQGIQGLQGGQLQTIDAETLRQLNLQGGGVRIIQIPAGGIQTAGLQTTTLNQGATFGLIGGNQGTRTQVITTRTENEAAIAAPAPAPLPPAPRARVTVVSNDVEGDAAEPAPEPYSFSYTADTEDGASSERSESQDAQGRVTGFYTIIQADGTKRRVDYVADENGYRATISTNEFGTSSSNPADVVIDSSQPSPSELSKQWTEDQERNGGQQKTRQQNQQQAIFRTQTTSTETTSRTGGNFEFIGPEAIQETPARTATLTVTQEQPQQQFVVVRVPAGQVPPGAVPVGQFVNNRQAAASERRPFFSEFGARQRQASASARQGIKI